MSNRLHTAREVRTWFYDQGLSVTDWARDHGFPRQAVYAVLSGKSRCTRGRGHQIAVALGMKRSDIVAVPYARNAAHHERQDVHEAEQRTSSWRAAGLGQLATTSTTGEVPP